MKKVYSTEEKREYFAKQIQDLKDGIEKKIQSFLSDTGELRRVHRVQEKPFLQLQHKQHNSYS